MTREEVQARINAALEKEFNSDGKSWSFSIGAPPDALNDGNPAGIHNFMVTATAPILE